MSSPGLIRVLIAEDNELLRNGLAEFLDLCDDIEVVGRVENGKLALTLCGEVSPDVVLMDLSMPVMDGVTATRLIREQYPAIQVVVLTHSFEQNRKQASFEAGASAYLIKNVTVDEIADAIRAAKRNDSKS
jgi:DNA-binding NarL/FixJ family response regulator